MVGEILSSPMCANWAVQIEMLCRDKTQRASNSIVSPTVLWDVSQGYIQKSTIMALGRNGMSWCFTLRVLHCMPYEEDFKYFLPEEC